jgi:hypothetical protein
MNPTRRLQHTNRVSLDGRRNPIASPMYQLGVRSEVSLSPEFGMGREAVSGAGAASNRNVSVGVCANFAHAM